MSFKKKLVGHTWYQLEISFKVGERTSCFQKQVRYTDMEALDEVLNSAKYRNLKFPQLPSKAFLQLSEAATRFCYLQKVCDTILDYSLKDPQIKKQLFNYLYNFLFMSDIKAIPELSKRADEFELMLVAARNDDQVVSKPEISTDSNV